MPVLDIRRATVEDAEDIARLLEVAFRAFEPQYTHAAYAATVPPAHVLAARMNAGDPTWIATLDARVVVGTVSAVLRGDAGIYVRSMAVAPDMRGHGVGARLLESVESFAREQDARRLFLSTTPFLHSAIGLYTRTGFVHSSDGPHDLHGTAIITMEKQLDASATRPHS